jgi:hypothetical protein
MKIRPVGTKLLHANRQTDTTKLIVDFRNSANAHKNGNFLWRIIRVSLAVMLCYVIPEVSKKLSTTMKALKL